MATGLVSSLLSSLAKLADLLPSPPAVSWPSRGERPTVSEDLQRLQRLLRRIQATLEDAGEREVRDSSVKLWLEELRDVALGAEDVLDDHRYELLRRRVQERQGGAASRKRKHDDGLDQYEEYGGMRQRIGEITRRFEEISRDRAALQLGPEDGERISGRDSKWESRTSSHLLDESLVFGRLDEKEGIIESVLYCSQGTGTQVLPVVGMGGIGKTTVAQMVYNHGRVKEAFDLRGWVHVSQVTDLRKLTIAITESLTRKQCGYNELSVAHHALKKTVDEKSVFLVLDDVWNEPPSFWQDLLGPFKSAKMVMILLTTRSKEVARLVQTVRPVSLGSLPEEHCWLLFRRYAFGNRVIDEKSRLVQVGKKIMQKCGGLPLAVKSIGCLLRSKMDMQTWMEISESEFWENSDDNEEVFSALRLSFYRLPAKLKPCFLLCTAYTKGQPFMKDDMIHLWIAHGYIHPKRSKTPEKIAGEYFDELIERSLIEQDLDLNDRQYLERRLLVEEHLFNNGKTFDDSHIRSLIETFCERKTEDSSDQLLLSFQEFRLHDIVWDLAKSLSSHMLSVTDDDEGIVNMSNKVEHLFLSGTYRENIVSKKRENSLKSSHGPLMKAILSLRTSEDQPKDQSTDFYVFYNDIVQQKQQGITRQDSSFHTWHGRFCHLRKMNYSRTLVIKNWYYDIPIDIHRFTYMRALVLDSCSDRACISAIRNLKHLRYLQVTNCFWVSADNQNHVTESVCDLYSLEKLIVSTCCREFSMTSCNLFSLRYLHLSGEFSDQSLHSFGHLYNLDTLCLQKCGSITELPVFIGNLINLKRLQLGQISKIVKFSHNSFRCQINNKCQLTEVIFPALEEIEFDGLYNLRDWCGVQDSDCPNLQSIIIRNCCKLRIIPNFSSVRKLSISKSGMTYLQLSMCNSPSQLHTLDIQDCQNLTSLMGLKHLSSLGSLYIARCPELFVFRKEKLPYRPQQVFIDDCLLLKEWCDEQELYYQVPEMVKISDLERAKEHGVSYFQSFKHLSVDIFPEKGQELILTPDNWLSSDLRLLRFCCESHSVVSSIRRGPSTIRRLEIRGCPMLVALMGLEELDVLHTFIIEDCPLLYILPETKFPPRLSSLTLHGCHKLLSLHLNVSDPSMFTELEVSDCQRLMHIKGLRYFRNLESLLLLHCPLLELRELLPCIPESIAVFLCPKLKRWCDIQSIEYQESVPNSSYDVDA